MSNKIDLERIIKIERVINNVHESSFRSYHVLETVLTMIDRGDSKETIKEVAYYLSHADYCEPQVTEVE